MRTIFISAGHSNVLGKDRGASGNGFVEGILTVEQRNLIVKELKNLGAKVIIDDNDSILSQTMAFFRNKTTKNCILVDLHWNAATSQATGTEVLVPVTPTKFEMDLATDLSKAIANTLKIKNRGVKTELQSARKSLGWMRLTGENILIETCFISNKKDMDNYQKNKEELAKQIALILFNYSNEMNSQKIYIVKSGDSLSKIARENNTTIEKIQKDNNLKSTTIQTNQKLKI
jgi:N-acetylmuramoyl-L-alanine amidase